MMERIQAANSVNCEDSIGIIPDEGEESSFEPSFEESHAESPSVTQFSKFSQLLGFGPPPVTMGSVEEDSGDVSLSNNYTNTPLEPSFYRIGFRMADQQWKMNYQESAIYLEEGAENDKFSTHPKRKESLPAYVLAHTGWYYVIDFAASVLLLSLAVAEPPAIDALHVPIGLHASVEVSCLFERNIVEEGQIKQRPMIKNRSNNRKLLCCKCNKKYHLKAKDGSVKLHNETFHTSEEDKPWECGICHKKFVKKYNLDYHQRIHNIGAKHQCSFCSYSTVHLTILVFELVLKLRWLGFKTLFTHHRTTLKATTLVVMVVEAIVILVRQSSHFRVTRALRPIFLVDNRYCRGVRRFVRQVLQSLPPILDMLALLLFFLLIFTLLGHFIFGHDADDPFFSSVDDSFVSLFVLLTTANFPDVMMPAYAKNPWSVLFFTTYLVIVLYLFMNLLLAVVYDTFTTLEREKFHKLVIHRRKACAYAFNLLVSKSQTSGIIFRHYYGMMCMYKPQKTLRDIYLTFRALDKDGNGVISKEEFMRFYEVAHLKWKPIPVNGFQKKWPIFEAVGVHAQRFLNAQYSDHIFNSIIVLNTVAMLIRWVGGGGTDQTSWDAYIFSLCFVLEMALKVVTWGFPRVISSGWHTFDLVATILFLVTIVLAKFVPAWDELMTFVRPLRLLRLFKMKKRYRDVFGTVFILIPPMSSASVVILLMYYFYSIIGMELFAMAPLKNCCNGTNLESYFADTGNQSFALRYYLNNFENLFSSYVTLFELTVVNNWYVIMEGHVQVTSRYSRIYFMSFYLSTMVILTIIIAFILDSFIFRIQYKSCMNKRTEDKMLRTEVSLNQEEIDFCYRQFTDDSRRRLQILQDYGEDLASKGYVTYVGFRRRTKEILYKRMFRTEMPEDETEPILPQAS